MKVILLSIAVLVSSIALQEKPKLEGAYRTEFDKNYGHLNYQITFSDSIYVKRMPDAVTSKGKIVYEKYKVTLRKNSDEDPMIIDSREIGKDTIKFSVKSKVDQSRSLFSGKLIKVK